tara:strand:- start:129 stop:467 length:339 start_codon:yes stop_codon:yes gene_type:complete
MSLPYKEKESNQITLFGRNNIKKSWENEWQDMPEFHQKKVEAHATIVIRFRNEEDLQKFAKLVEQTHLNINSKSMWFPELERKDLYKRGELNYDNGKTFLSRDRYVDKKNDK